jgi:hypothetical protein
MTAESGLVIGAWEWVINCPDGDFFYPELAKSV